MNVKHGPSNKSKIDAEKLEKQFNDKSDSECETEILEIGLLQDDLMRSPKSVRRSIIEQKERLKSVIIKVNKKRYGNDSLRRVSEKSRLLSKFREKTKKFQEERETDKSYHSKSTQKSPTHTFICTIPNNHTSSQK